MKARAPLALTPADPQPQPHPARQGHHIPAILVAQPHVSAAPRAVLPERHQDPLPLRPPPCRNPGHLAPPEVTDHCSYQRTTPAAFAGLEKNFASLDRAALLNTTAATPIEIWFQDEARVGQKGTHAYIWAPIGSRPLMVRDNPHTSAYLFGAICPARGVGAAMIVP